jgi:HAT1-interacting factor 1
MLIADPRQVLATAAAANAESSAKSTAKISFSGDAEAEDGEDDEDGAPEEEEDKEDDFQIAWEVLETAKMLYESQLESKKGKSAVGRGSQDDTAIERKMADVCDLLGEVSIENGHYPVFFCADR